MGTGIASVRPFSRHTRNNRGNPPVRTSEIRVSKTRRLPPTVNKHRVVVVTTHPNQTKRNKKEMRKRKAREWRDVLELINDDEVSDLTGIMIDEESKDFISIEGEVITAPQYLALIGELEHRLGLNNDAYEQKILKKAIRFVRKKAGLPDPNVNDITQMMGRL